MKKFYSLLFTLLVTVAAMSQTRTWTGAVSTSWADAGNWSGNNVPNSNTEIAVFDLGSTITVTNVPGTALGGLIVTNNSAVNISKPAAGGVNTLSINNTAAAIDFSIASGSSLELGNEVNITLASGSAGNPTTAEIAGEFKVNNRTYNTNNTNVVTNVTGSGVIETVGGAVTCNNTARLTFANGTSYVHGGNGGAVPYATWNSGSLLSVTGITTTALGALDQAFSDITWNCANQTVTNMRFNQMTALRNLKIMSTGTGSIRVYSAGGTASIPTTGSINNFEITGGTLNLSVAGGIGTLNIGGNYTQSSGTISETSSGSGAVNFTGTSVQTFTKSGGTISNTINFTINSNAIVDFGTSVLDGSSGTFTLSAGGKIITANAGGIASTIQVSGAQTFSSGADYEFNGASTGVFATTPTASTVRNMTINNTSGNVTLSQPMAVTGTLSLTDGELTTDATNLITINDNATTSGASDNSFVNGPMAKAGDDAFTFPVGKSGVGLRVIGISAPTVSSTFTAEFLRTDPRTAIGATLGTGIAQVSGCEYWTLDRTGTGDASVILSWNAASPCNGAPYVTNTGTLTVAHWDGSSWVNEGRLSTTGDNTAGTITTANVLSSFSPFALASVSISDNPLPVMFADVKAYQQNSGVKIEWSNLTERDLIKYVVERSANGQTFSAINEQLPKSNNNDKESYTAYDASPLAGVNFYRIKVYEIGGKIIYSKVLKVDLSGRQEGFGLYPNPVTSGQVSVTLSSKQGQYGVKVFNSAGQQVYSQRMYHQGGMMTQTVDLSTVKPGIYNMVITGENYREAKMFIVQ